MKKTDEKTTQKAMMMYDNAIVYYHNNPHTEKRLLSCTAKVIITDKYYLLQSYSTIVAVIDRTTNTLYDVLRVVYGYTATSAQHIAKFNREYGNSTWGCKNKVRVY